MCEAKVYLETKGESELIMSDVVSITPVDNHLDLIDLFGEKKSIDASIKELKLLDHIVLLKPASGD